MKQYPFILPLFVLLFGAGGSLFAQSDTSEINLIGTVAFKTGDDPVWRSKFIDEAEGWNFIDIPSAWEEQGYPLHDGFGWYRIRFQLPLSMRGDSLVVIFSAIDDADETYFNGQLIGKSGSFPPNEQSELRSVRIYPLPRVLQEEFNLLAVRVCDFGNTGGITGDIIRVVRAEDVGRYMQIIESEPHTPPNMFISNGVAVSEYNPSFASIQWMKPHVFSEVDFDLKTENIISNLTLSVALDGYVHRLSEYEIQGSDYFQNTSIIRTVFKAGFEVYWYHPSTTKQRVLVVMLRHKRGINIEDVGALFTVDRDYWRFRDYVEELPQERRHYFVFVYNSCCDELVERDLTDFLGETESQAMEAISLERELLRWKIFNERLDRVPPHLSPSEEFVYRHSIVTLQMAQVNEQGSAFGQIVSAFTPATAAYTVPRQHLNSVMALASVGLIEEAAAGLAFVQHAEVGRYVFFDVYGSEFGTGLPYLVTPAKYFGMGREYHWEEPLNARLSYDGMAYYVQAVQYLQDATRRLFKEEKSPFNDSLFVKNYWPTLSKRVCDVLMHMSDSLNLIQHDGGPWGPGLDPSSGIYSSIHAAAALRIGAGYAQLMGDDNRHTDYLQASRAITRTLDSLIRVTTTQIEESALTVIEKNLFHPLLCDGVRLGVFMPRSDATSFALEMMESSFAVDGASNMYHAKPDGDWFDRQARPFLSLRLARAYAAERSFQRAEDLFAEITSIAAANYGLLPELIEPNSRNWYGGTPAIGFGAAEYILAAQAISEMREVRKGNN
ncbi:MAG: hypothetical protein CL946_02350 [Ectothiorhodospiraceae bacterium]|nr:hypothetical protein [Ectothiorhodospiraceae bacterium]